jgi:hypothetical protein
MDRLFNPNSLSVKRDGNDFEVLVELDVALPVLHLASSTSWTPVASSSPRGCSSI